MRSNSLGACLTNCSHGQSTTERKCARETLRLEWCDELDHFIFSCTFVRNVATYRVRHGLGDRTAPIGVTAALLPSVIIAVILERRAPTIIRPVHSGVVTAVDVGCVAPHRYLVVFQVASPGAP